MRERQHPARVHVVRKRAVSDARHAIADHTHTRACGQMQRQVHRVEQRERGAERVSSHGDGGRAVLCEQCVHVREDRRRCPGLQSVGGSVRVLQG